MRDSRPPTGIHLESTIGDPLPVHILIVIVSEAYNNTEIVCIARFDDDRMHQDSIPAYLSVSCKLILIIIILLQTTNV